MRRTERQRRNDRVRGREEVRHVLEEFRYEDPNVVESVRERIAVEFGALMGVRFRLRERLGAEAHPKLVHAEMARFFGGIWIGT